MKTRVVFLDIDGVLNSTRYWDANKPLPMGQAGAIDPEAVARLNRIVKATHADVVISSSWRTMGVDLVQAMLKERGFVGAVNGATPVKLGCDRCTEIEDWLYAHKYAAQWWRFAVLDDDPRAWRQDSDFGQWGRFFPTNYLAGLTDEHVDLVIAWLNDGKATT